MFVLFYLLFLILMGAPVLTMELAVGRASGKSAVLGYKALERPGSKWHIHGWFCLLGCYLLMMYYTTVSGWMLGYFFKFASGTFSAMACEAVDGVFGAMLASPGEMALWMAATVLAGFLVCSFGLQKGHIVGHITDQPIIAGINHSGWYTGQTFRQRNAQTDNGFAFRPDVGRSEPGFHLTETVNIRKSADVCTCVQYDFSDYLFHGNSPLCF